MPPNNPTVARAALVVARDTRHFVNTFHVGRKDNAILNDVDLEDIAVAFATWWNTNYRALVKANIVGESITVTKLDPSDPIQFFGPVVGAGTWGPGTVSPADVTLAMAWKTGLAGRKFRGRFYNFGVPSDQVTSIDTIVGGYQATCLAVCNALLLLLDTAGFELVIFHRADDTKTTVTSASIEGLVDSQRNRLAGRGT